MHFLKPLEQNLKFFEVHNKAKTCHFWNLLSKVCQAIETGQHSKEIMIDKYPSLRTLPRINPKSNFNALAFKCLFWYRSYNLNSILRLVPDGAYRALFKNSKLKLFWPDMGFVFKIQYFKKTYLLLILAKIVGFVFYNDSSQIILLLENERVGKLHETMSEKSFKFGFT